MIVTFKDIKDNEYEYSLNDLEVQFIITADKAGMNYEFQNLYAKTNPNVLYNIFSNLQQKNLKEITITREENVVPLQYIFSDPNSVYSIYGFSTLERNQNIPTVLRDVETLRFFVAFSNNNNEEE